MIVGLSVVVVAVFAALLGLLWLLTRNPSRDRQLIDARTDVGLQRDLIARLYQEALNAADVNPVAQVFLDEITQSGMSPAQLKREGK